jgi:cell division protein FtsI/penicillin-binding protein 2
MSPRTGEILAMACEPSFEPARYREFEASRRRNRTITDPVEPGSTFKPFIAAGALHLGYVSTTEMIDCRDGLHYFGDRRVHDTSPHGRLDLRGIIVHSSNIGMGMLGERMGNRSLRDTLVAFGFDRATQAGLPGESGGIVPALRRWTSYSTTSVPMGQEIAVTPLQLANAFCALVNGGYLLRPRLVRERIDGDGRTLDRHDRPAVIRRVLTEQVADYFAEAVLPGVVERGPNLLETGQYTMGGKTGTAQVPYVDRRGYEPNAYLSSFIGAAPVSDPQIVVLVMIRKPDPSQGYYGRVVAGPVVGDIVRSTLQYLGVPPDNDRVASARH